MSERKLHIGARGPFAGWETLNITPLAGIDHICDARNLGMFEDGTFQCLYASHVLEHFDYRDMVQEVLREWHRVLAPGGRLFVSVPDLEKICSLFLDRDRCDVNDRFLLMRMMMGGHTDSHDYHLTAFNWEFLTHYLTAAGFIDIQRKAEFSLFNDTSSLRLKGELISLNLTAVRPPA